MASRGSVNSLVGETSPSVDDPSYPPPLTLATSIAQNVLWPLIEKGLPIPENVYTFFMRPIHGLTRRDLFHLMKARGWDQDSTYLVNHDDLWYGIHQSRDHVCPGTAVEQRKIQQTTDSSMTKSSMATSVQFNDAEDTKGETKALLPSSFQGTNRGPPPGFVRGRGLLRMWSSESKEDSPIKRGRASVVQANLSAPSSGEANGPQYSAVESDVESAPTSPVPDVPEGSPAFSETRGSPVVASVDCLSDATIELVE